jgi:outer membrane protease
VRSLYYVIKDDKTMTSKYNPSLVPRMCINRYYVAEGVRVYAIETWRQVFGDQGKQTVRDYADQICDFYIS